MRNKCNGCIRSYFQLKSNLICKFAIYSCIRANLLRMINVRTADCGHNTEAGLCRATIAFIKRNYIYFAGLQICSIRSVFMFCNFYGRATIVFGY